MASTYIELLKSPKWQKKRLEILQAADFKCEMCGNHEEELHVHHWTYDSGKKPWEYSEFKLSALCKTCHESVTERKKVLERLIANLEKRASGGMEAVLLFAMVVGSAGIEASLEEMGFELRAKAISRLVDILGMAERHNQELEKELSSRKKGA
jgi:hypothetical protein